MGAARAARVNSQLEGFRAGFVVALEAEQPLRSTGEAPSSVADHQVVGETTSATRAVDNDSCERSES